MVKVGIVRCEGAMRICPGTSCFRAIREKTGNFAPYSDEEIEIIGMVPCGGCPGRDAVRQSVEMVRRGAEVIFLGTCMIKPIPSEPVCRYSEEIAGAIRKKTGVEVIMGTH